MGETFPRSHRLLSGADYRRVFTAPDAKAGGREVLLLARANRLPSHRLGLAIAKKHLPTAVERNLMKRLAREHFRRMDSRRANLDIVVLSRPGAVQASRQALRAALEHQFQRLLHRVQSQ